MTTQPRLSVTRVINPCALVSVDDAAFLTDPYFEEQRILPMNEAIGMRASELPPLSAVLGGHGAFDHWQPGSLRGAVSPQVPVLVPHRRMAERAKRAGFTDVRETRDGERLRISATVSVTTVAGDRVMRQPTHHYLISGSSGTIYVGTEACSLQPMHRIAGRARVDVAVLPIDGLTFAGRQLVMRASAAIDAALVLGARILVPFHYSQRSVPPLIRCTSGLDELLELAVGRIEVRHAPTGASMELVS